MTRRRTLTAAVSLLPLALGLAVPPRTAQACGAETHRSRGLIRGFGPARADVRIEHEKIEDYGGAATTSFEPRAPAQLDGLAVGDAVTFSFTETEEGQRLLNTIKRE